MYNFYLVCLFWVETFSDAEINKKKKKKMFIWTQFYRDQPAINSDKPRWEETKSKRKDFDDKLYFYHNDRFSSEP